MPADSLTPAAGPYGPSVSLVVPVYRGAATLPELVQRCERLRAASSFEGPPLIAEIIAVCDDPIDNSEAQLGMQAASRPWIRVISLARNGGQHLATAAGILHSCGDWVLTIDEDLQHPPELLPELLAVALVQHLDVLYVRAKSRVHATSIYRDLSSRTSKALIGLFTRDDYSPVSSFRLIRGEVARAVAVSIDPGSYLDASIYAATSRRRRGVHLAEFQDLRPHGQSGYTFPKLLRHFARLILSSELSGVRLLTTLIAMLVFPLLLTLCFWSLQSFLGGAVRIAPGWLSLFVLGISIHLMMLLYFVFALKLLAILVLRTSGLPSFLVIDRSADDVHLEALRNDWSAESLAASRPT